MDLVIHEMQARRDVIIYSNFKFTVEKIIMLIGGPISVTICLTKFYMYLIK